MHRAWRNQTDQTEPNNDLARRARQASEGRPYLPSVALQAVLTVLSGAMLADLAVGDGRVALVRALAAVVDRRVDDEPGRPAEERLGAAAFELTDAGRRELSRARIDTVTVQQIPAIAALRRRSEAPTATIEKARTAVQCVTKPGTNETQQGGDTSARAHRGGQSHAACWRPLTTRQVSPAATLVQKLQRAFKHWHPEPACDPVWIRRFLHEMAEKHRPD